MRAATIKKMRTILSFEDSLKLVRELSEHQRRRDPAAPCVAAGLWPRPALKPVGTPWVYQRMVERAELLQVVQTERMAG